MFSRQAIAAGHYCLGKRGQAFFETLRRDMGVQANAIRFSLLRLGLQADLRDSEVLAASRIIHSHVQPGCKDVLVMGGNNVWQHCRSQSWLFLTGQGIVCGHLPRQLDLALHRPILHSQQTQSDEASDTQGHTEHLSPQSHQILTNFACIGPEDGVLVQLSERLQVLYPMQASAIRRHRCQWPIVADPGSPSALEYPKLHPSTAM